MEPFSDDENVQDEGTPAATPADTGVVTGSPPYDAADDDDFEDD
jgi:hypothetical protein